MSCERPLAPLVVPTLGMAASLALALTASAGAAPPGSSPTASSRPAPAATVPGALTRAAAPAADDPEPRPQGRLDGPFTGELGEWSADREPRGVVLRLPSTSGARASTALLLAVPLRGFVEPGTPKRPVTIARATLTCGTRCGNRRVPATVRFLKVRHDGRYRLRIVLRTGSRTVADVSAATRQLRIDRTAPKWKAHPRYAVDAQGQLFYYETPPPADENELQPWQAGLGNSYLTFFTQPSAEHPNGQRFLATITGGRRSKAFRKQGVRIDPPESGVTLSLTADQPTSPPPPSTTPTPAPVPSPAPKPFPVPGPGPESTP